MIIVSWNCNGKFREKFKKIKKLNADIYVIQECENPKKYNNSEYSDFAINYIWIGDNDNKGLAIFAKNNIILKNNNWKIYCLRNCISVNVNNNFDLIGVWACKPYIEEYYIYQNINFNKYNEKTVIIGDFNSNAKLDGKHDRRSHSKVVNELKNIRLTSAYHYKYLEMRTDNNEALFVSLIKPYNRLGISGINFFRYNAV